MFVFCEDLAHRIILFHVVVRISDELRDESKFSAGSLTGDCDLERDLRLRDLGVGEALPTHWEHQVDGTV